MNILDSLEPVLTQSTSVKLLDEKIKAFAHTFDESKVYHWLSICPFDLRQLTEVEKMNFLFTLDSISFSYWGTPRWTVDYSGKIYDGSKAMMICLVGAIAVGANFSPKCLANIQRSDLENILRGSVEIPLLDERVKILNEVGRNTQKKYGGDFRYIVDSAEGDVIRFIDIIGGTFQSFEDVSDYNRNKVFFRKRAQLLAADLNNFFGCFETVEVLTACADYKIPQVLRRYGILQYSDELQKKIILRKKILVGSMEEVEIRAHTIHAVELIKKELNCVTSNQINDYLWLEGQKKELIDEPYHRTRTIAY